MTAMHSEPVVYREEVADILTVLGDINVNIARIVGLLEEELDGGEPEEDG